MLRIFLLFVVLLGCTGPLYVGVRPTPITMVSCGGVGSYGKCGIATSLVAVYDGGEWKGSGVVIGRRKILTAHHVIEGIPRPMVVEILCDPESGEWALGRRVGTEVIGFHSGHDVAVVEAQEDLTGTPMPLSRIPLSRGDDVLLAGLASKTSVGSYSEEPFYGLGTGKLTGRVLPGDSGGAVVGKCGLVGIILTRGRFTAGFLPALQIVDALTGG